MKEYCIKLVKECYARVMASSEDEAVAMGYDMVDNANYDDEVVCCVECLGESSDDMYDEFGGGIPDIYCNDVFGYGEEMFGYGEE